MAISLVGVFGETVEVELDLSFFSTENKIKKERKKEIVTLCWLILLLV